MPRRYDPVAQIDAAEREGVLEAAEAAQLRTLDELVLDVIGVDDFDSSELGTKAKKPRRPRKKAVRKRAPQATNGQDAAAPS